MAQDPKQPDTTVDGLYNPGIIPGMSLQDAKEMLAAQNNKPAAGQSPEIMELRRQLAAKARELELQQERAEKLALENQTLQQSLNIERSVNAMLKAKLDSGNQGGEIENLRRQIQKLVTENLHLKQAAEKEAADLRRQIAELRDRAPASAPQPEAVHPGEKRRIEGVLNDYLTSMSAADEQELADRFRETAFILMDCSVEEVTRVMRSPVIGTDLNKRLLRNQARRSNRLDIAQSI